MKSEEIYDSWKKQKSLIEVHKDFTDRVMNGIYKYEQKKRKPLFDVQQLVELISAHPLTKAGLIAAGAVIGFFRVGFMIAVILGG